MNLARVRGVFFLFQLILQWWCPKENFFWYNGRRLLIVRCDIVIGIACWSCKFILWCAWLADRASWYCDGRRLQTETETEAEAETEAETKTETEAEAGTETEAEAETESFFLLCFPLLSDYLCEWNWNCKINFHTFFTFFAWIQAPLVPRQGNSKKMKCLQTLRGVSENPPRNWKT